MIRVVVWKVNGLGDFVSFLPTLLRLIDAYGIENILFVLSPISYEVLKIYCVPTHYILISRDRLIRLYKRPFRLWQLSLKIKFFRADKAYFTFDECSSAYLTSFLAGIPHRIGYDSKIAFTQLLLTEKLSLPADKNIYDIHAVLVDEGVMNKKSNIRSEIVPLPHNIRDEVLFHEPYIVIHPFAQFQYREWHIDNYLRLACMIEEQLDIRTVVIGEEKHIHWFDNYSYKRQLNNTIRDLFDIIANCMLYVGNNSGPMHIAIVNQVPFLSIEGPSASNWGPNSNLRHKRLRSSGLRCAPCETIYSVPMKCKNTELPNGCLKSITVEEVFKEVCKLLNALK